MFWGILGGDLEVWALPAYDVPPLFGVITNSPDVWRAGIVFYRLKCRPVHRYGRQPGHSGSSLFYQKTNKHLSELEFIEFC